MPESLWVLPILSGYYFLSRFVYFKYKYARLEPQRLIFNSFITGAILLLIFYALRILVSLLIPNFIPTTYYLLYKLPIEKQPLLWTFLFEFIVVILGVEIVNRILAKVKYFGRITPVERAVDILGDEIEQLFKKAAKEQRIIQITLKSNKVYVAFVNYIPPPKESNYLKIIPLISGYRNDKTKKITFNTDYYDAIHLYQSVEEKHSNFEMDVTIKQDEILMAHIFDQDVYEAFKKK